MKRRIVLVASVLALAGGLCAEGQAAEACGAYMMDVDNEVELFASEAAAIVAGRDARNAPEIDAGRLYQVRLLPQADIKYLKSSARRPIEIAKPGGMVRFVSPGAGRYRVAVDANFWIDVVFDGEPMASGDFRSDRECPGPRKIVTFNLPAGAEVIVQLIDAPSASVRLTVTPEPPKVW